MRFVTMEGAMNRWGRRPFHGWTGFGLFVIASGLVLGMMLTVASASAQAETADEGMVATFETADGSIYKALLEGEANIDRAEEALAGDGDAGIPNGELVAGDGGINAPHEWYVVNVELVDATTELCDATATMVDDDLDYWLEDVGRFCPWNATLIALDPVVDELPVTGVGPSITELQLNLGMLTGALVLTFGIVVATANVRGWRTMILGGRSAGRRDRC
jgi:hypothetical protein